MIKELWIGFLKDLGVISDEETSNIEAPIQRVDLTGPTLSKETQQAVRDAREMRTDQEAPNLFVGKIINDGTIKCQVVSCTEDDFRVKILEIGWDRLGTYLDLDQTYPLRSCYTGKGMNVWEVDPDTMKRSFSQVLLAWEKDLGWTWDIDS
jgi:hypothetical protein